MSEDLKNNIRDLWDNIKIFFNIYENWAEKQFEEIMAENFLNLVETNKLIDLGSSANCNKDKYWGREETQVHQKLVKFKNENLERQRKGNIMYEGKKFH